MARRPPSARVERVDVALLALLGLLFLAGGTVVLLAGAGVLGEATAQARLLTEATRAFAADHAWFWPLVAAGAGLVALAALWWLAAQFRTGRLRALDLADDDLGVVRVNGDAIAEAVERDALEAPAVRDARVRLLGSQSDPLVRLLLTTEPDADLEATRLFAEDEVLARARDALRRPDLRGEVRLDPEDVRPRRAR